MVDDLRQILNNPDNMSSHTSRNNSQHHLSHSNFYEMDYYDHEGNMTNYTYRIRFVPNSIRLEVLKNHLSYYSPIDDLKEVDNLPAHQREILCTFNASAKIQLLKHIWAVNVQGYNLSIAKAHLPNAQLEYRKQYVAGFRGFNYKITES